MTPEISPMRAFTYALLIALLATVALSGCGSSEDPPGANATGATPTRGVATGPVPGAPSGSQRHVIYIAEGEVWKMLETMFPEGAEPLHRVETYRQMPAQWTILDETNRIARVTAIEFKGMTAQQIAQRLKRAINRTCTKRWQCKSHIAAIDDINTDFRGAGGTRLLKAMRMLDTPSPWGGTYARRVMMYVPIQMMDGLRNPNERAQWLDAAKAVAMGESYWLEMYKSVGKGEMGDVDYAAWTTGVERTMTDIHDAGGQVARAHFMIGPAIGAISGAPKSMCPDGIACAWKAIIATGLNYRIAMNGYGYYRFGLRQVKALCHRAFTDKALIGQDEDHRVVVTGCTNWLGKGNRAKAKAAAAKVKPA